MKSNRIYINITNTLTVTNTTNTTNTTTSVVNDPNIKTSSPSSTNVHIFSEDNKTFVITAEDYDTIKWYLNGALVKENVLEFYFSNLEDGDIVKVEIINGTRLDSKTWNIKIEDDEELEDPVFDVGLVIFYLIIAVVSIIIFLVIWLFIIEKNRGSRAGFGVLKVTAH